MPKQNRRAVLRGVGAAAVGSLAFTSTTATAAPGNGNGGNTENDRGFPPSGITEWGDSAPYGDGEVSAFTSVTPSGNPKHLGVTYSPGVFEGLPDAEDFEDGDAEGVFDEEKGLWIQPANLALPDDVPAPFEYVGFGWNPDGHTPEGVYDVPHFDIHFYFHAPETIKAIKGGVIEDVPDETTPEGYRLIEGGAIIPQMGAHLAPKDAPEFNGGEWEDTLIWGAADVDDDDEPELNFIEPMITLDYLENLDGVERQAIPQPDVYPQEGYYPTSYVRRKLDDGGVAVTLSDFEKRD